MTNKRKRERVRNAQKRDAKNNDKREIMKHAALKVAKAYTSRWPIEASILASSTLAPYTNPYRSMILSKIAFREVAKALC